MTLHLQQPWLIMSTSHVNATQLVLLLAESHVCRWCSCKLRATHIVHQHVHDHGRPGVLHSQHVQQVGQMGPTGLAAVKGPATVQGEGEPVRG
jgi:hypothetical protein